MQRDGSIPRSTTSPSSTRSGGLPAFLTVPALSASSSNSSAASDVGPFTPLLATSSGRQLGKEAPCSKLEASELARGYREQVLRDQARRLESLLGLPTALFPEQLAPEKQPKQEPFNVAAWSSTLPASSPSRQCDPAQAFADETIFEGLPDAIFVLQPEDGLILYASAMLKQVLGLDDHARLTSPKLVIAEPLIGSLLIQRCHPDDVPRVGCLLRSSRCPQGGNSAALSRSDELVRLRQADGQFAVFDLRARCGFFDAGPVEEGDEKAQRLIVCTARLRELLTLPAGPNSNNGALLGDRSAIISAALQGTCRFLVSANGLVLETFGSEDVFTALLDCGSDVVRGSSLDDVFLNVESREHLKALLQIAVDSGRAQTGDFRTPTKRLAAVVVTPCIDSQGRVCKAFIELSSPCTLSSSSASAAQRKRKRQVSGSKTAPCAFHRSSAHDSRDQVAMPFFLAEQTELLRSENEAMRHILRTSATQNCSAAAAAARTAAVASSTTVNPTAMQAPILALHNQDQPQNPELDHVRSQQQQQQRLQQQQEQISDHFHHHQHSRPRESPQQLLQQLEQQWLHQQHQERSMLQQAQLAEALAGVVQYQQQQQQQQQQQHGPMFAPQNSWLHSTSFDVPFASDDVEIVGTSHGAGIVAGNPSSGLCLDISGGAFTPPLPPFLTPNDAFDFSLPHFLEPVDHGIGAALDTVASM